MTGATAILVKLGARLVLFGLVFFVMARKNPKVIIRNKWTTPLIALVFAVLNTALYWALSPVLDLASLGVLGFVMPFAANLVFLLITIRIFQSRSWLEVQGFRATLWITILLGLAHSLIWFGLDYLPAHV